MLPSRHPFVFHVRVKSVMFPFLTIFKSSRVICSGCNYVYLWKRVFMSIEYTIEYTSMCILEKKFVL